MSHLLRFFAAVACGLAMFVAAGCSLLNPTKDVPVPPPPPPLVKTPTTADPPPGEKQSLPGIKVQQGVYSLPGMQCLVTEHGIRLKVIAIRRGVRCLDRVPSGTATGSTLRFFLPYFVFDVYPRQGDVQFYQVGTTPRRDSILGWAPSSAVAAWTHRVGERYRREPGERVPPLLVYADKGPLQEIIKSGSTRAEPMARASLYAEQTWMAWPIAEVDQVATPDGQVHEMVRLLFLGENRDGSGTATTPAYSTEERQQIQAKLKMLDVVWCLDVTGSMGPYIEAAKETIRDTSRRLRELEFQPDIAFGVVGYRDYDKESTFVTQRHDLDRDFEQFLSRLAGFKASAGGDTSEAVYDAVLEALEKMSWRGQGLSARVIILVGDASAHDPPDPQNPRGTTRAQLVEEARKRGVKIFSLAVGRREGNSDWERLWKQFSDLADRTGGQCEAIANASVVVDKIRSILRSESAWLEWNHGVFTDLSSGKTPEQIARERHADIRKVTEVLEFLKGAGVDVSRLTPGEPTFATGWALCELKGVPVLERHVYLARSELDLLLGALNVLSARLSADSTRYIIDAGVASRLGPLAPFFDGQVPEPLDVFLLARGIPVGRSSILRMKESDLRTMTESRRAALRERITKKVIPALQKARNDDSLWFFRDDLEWGWLPERILP
jgi:hypothetical protein